MCNGALRRLALASMVCLAAACSTTEPEPQSVWSVIAEGGITVEYQTVDQAIAPLILRWAIAGRQNDQSYFGEMLAAPFIVRLYPDRATMESEWRAIFNAPGMVFQCWMIANANASQVLLLSSRAWRTQACGHDPADTVHTRRIIAHEIVHVLHRNVNPQPELPGMYPSWWLVEGLATVGSGQFDAGMRTAAAAALQNGLPAQLENIWTGNFAYELSASLVDYLDATFGREMLTALMRATNEAGILTMLARNEATLLAQWRQYVIEGISD
jgi:hypothetical protein